MATPRCPHVPMCKMTITCRGIVTALNPHSQSLQSVTSPTLPQGRKAGKVVLAKSQRVHNKARRHRPRQSQDLHPPQKRRLKSKVFLTVTYNILRWSEFSKNLIFRHLILKQLGNSEIKKSKRSIFYIINTGFKCLKSIQKCQKKVMKTNYLCWNQLSFLTRKIVKNVVLHSRKYLGVHIFGKTVN